MVQNTKKLQSSLMSGPNKNILSNQALWTKLASHYPTSVLRWACGKESFNIQSNRCLLGYENVQFLRKYSEFVSDYTAPYWRSEICLFTTPRTSNLTWKSQNKIKTNNVIGPYVYCKYETVQRVIAYAQKSVFVFRLNVWFHVFHQGWPFGRLFAATVS
jgi:hypothetical protein